MLWLVILSNLFVMKSLWPTWAIRLGAHMELLQLHFFSFRKETCGILRSGTHKKQEFQQVSLHAHVFPGCANVQELSTSSQDINEVLQANIITCEMHLGYANQKVCLFFSIQLEIHVDASRLFLFSDAKFEDNVNVLDFADHGGVWKSVPT